MDPKKDIFSTTKGKWDFTIAIIVIVVFSVLIYQYLFNTEEEAIVQNPIEATQELSKAEAQQYLYTNSNTYQATTIQTEDAYDSDVITAVVISDIKVNNPADSISKPIDEVSKTVTAPVIQKTISDSAVTSTIKTLKTPIQAEEEIIPEPLEQIEDEILKESSVQIEEEITTEIETVESDVIAETKSTTVIVTTKETAKDTTMNCVVVVGVFKEVSNKDAIINKLKALGHNHKEGVLRDGLSYVGVPVSCESEQEMQKLLRKLNQDFGIDAWIMKL